jgi:histidinol-phosphatase (PHP family)
MFSDYHKEEQLAYKILDIKEELKKLGYTQFCTFDKLKPKFHNL